MSEDLKILEFGNAVSASLDMKIDDPILRSVLQDSIDKTVGALKYITDFKVVEEPEIVEAPQVDILRRFKMFGWKAKFASNGYHELKEHFKCRERHIPENITVKFIWKMVKELIEQRKVKDYE